MNIADMTSADTGGQSYKLAKAITGYTAHTSRSFIRGLDYIQFPYDILMGSHDIASVRHYLEKVDIVHCHNKYRYSKGWGNINPNARWLIHQHGRIGSSTDMNAVYADDQVRNALRVVSTLNLLHYVNNDPARWIPAPFDLHMMAAIKQANYKEHEGIRIAHSPTNRVYKNTELLMDVCAGIPGAELVLIEKQAYSECLKLRSTCDITFDQMHLCYGNSGLEGMCFGQPVIVGMDDSVRSLINEVVGYEPFIYATPETLKDVLTGLVNDADVRKHWGGLGYEYVSHWHDDRIVAEKVLKIYNSIL